MRAASRSVPSLTGPPPPGRAPRPPRRTSASKGAAPAAGRQQVADRGQPPGVEVGEAVRERAQPAEAPGGPRPPLPLGVRRPGHDAVGVVDPQPALLPRPRGQRHQPPQPGRAVLAALVEGVRGDPHGVDEADAGQERRTAARPGRRRVRPPRAPGRARPVGGHRVDVLPASTGHRAGVQEVELEVVDAQVRRGARSAVVQQLVDAGVGEVEADQGLSPVPAGRADQPVGVLGGQGRARTDDERRQPDAGPAARRPAPRPPPAPATRTAPRSAAPRRARGSTRRPPAPRRRRGRARRGRARPRGRRRR